MKGKVLKLFSLTPEGKIIRALSGGERSFSELVEGTGLSERWLSVKLKQLLSLGVVKLGAGGYTLDRERLHSLLAASLKEVAWAAACEIVENHPEVLSVLLYGSVAKGEVGEESDVDLLVVSEEPLELSGDEYELSMRYGVAFEITVLPLTEFLAVLHLRSSLLFGILEGYDVLFDRSGVAAMLRVLAREIHRDWRYLRDEGVWLRLKR